MDNNEHILNYESEMVDKHVQQNVSNERKLWVDSLRAIAMILVVYGHCVQGWTAFFVCTSPIKMPLFFIISGYLFNPKNGDAKVFFKNLLFKLVIPWIVLGMLHPTNPLTRFGELISGKTLWFMPCLIIGEIVWFFIIKISRVKWQIVLYGLILSCVGYNLTQLHILDYAMINRALTVQVFFIGGLLIKNYERVLLSKCKVILLLGIILYFALICTQMQLFPGMFIDVHNGRYFNLLFCFIIILIGCITIFFAFDFFNVRNRWLVYIGQNTLIIYIAHGLGTSTFSKIVLNTIGSTLIPLYTYALFKAFFAILLCCVLAVIFNRYFPELVGKKRQ